MKPIHLLRERTASTCILGLADVDYLLALHRRHLKVWPTGKTGCYRLVPAGYVGTIDAPACRLVIQPKIPLANFLYLLAPALGQVEHRESGEPSGNAELADQLATRFILLLNDRTRAGLHRAYVEQNEVGPFVRGRLDAAEQMRHGLARTDRLHYRSEEQTCDLACNQAARAAGEILLGCPFVHESTRAGLRGALAGYAAVRSLPLTRELVAAAEPGPGTEATRPLWELCRLLLDGLSHQGSGPCLSFLVSLERVFELYVAGQVQQTCRMQHQESKIDVCVQPWVHGNFSETRQPELVLHPDLTLGVAGNTGILDTKWKRLPRTHLLPRDVHQVVAYCAVLRAPLGVLVYPGLRDCSWRYRLGRSPEELWVYRLRVVGTPGECCQSVRRLTRRMVRMLRLAERA